MHPWKEPDLNGTIMKLGIRLFAVDWYTLIFSVSHSNHADYECIIVITFFEKSHKKK